jgi:hypothetical protein
VFVCFSLQVAKCNEARATLPFSRDLLTAVPQSAVLSPPWNLPVKRLESPFLFVSVLVSNSLLSLAVHSHSLRFKSFSPSAFQQLTLCVTAVKPQTNLLTFLTCCYMSSLKQCLCIYVPVNSSICSESGTWTGQLLSSLYGLKGCFVQPRRVPFLEGAAPVSKRSHTPTAVFTKCLYVRRAMKKQ